MECLCFVCRLIGHNKVDGEHDEYIQFDTTSTYKDVAQSVIPFIDAQPVTVQPASWLAGAGIYHKVTRLSIAVYRTDAVS